MVQSNGHSGGLALLWKNEGACVVIEKHNQYFNFKVENNQVGRWRIIGFYGCPERERRKELWEILINLASRSSLSWCVIGDFNDMVCTDEKRGGRPHPRSLLVGFEETINDCGLLDLGFVGDKFT